MNVVRLTSTVRTDPDAAEENEALLRDLEEIIRETLPTERADAYVASLRDRLLNGYDWRAHEAAINKHPQFVTRFHMSARARVLAEQSNSSPSGIACV